MQPDGPEPMPTPTPHLPTGPLWPGQPPVGAPGPGYPPPGYPPPGGQWAGPPPARQKRRPTKIVLIVVVVLAVIAAGGTAVLLLRKGSSNNSAATGSAPASASAKPSPNASPKATAKPVSTPPSRVGTVPAHAEGSLIELTMDDKRLYVAAAQDGKIVVTGYDPAANKVAWTFSEPSGDGIVTDWVQDGVVIVCVEIRDSPTVTALDAATGAKLWQRKFKDLVRAPNARPLNISSGRVIVRDAGTATLAGYDLRSGAPAWSVPIGAIDITVLGRYAANPAVSFDHLVLWRSTGRATVYRVTDGNVLGDKDLATLYSWTDKLKSPSPVSWEGGLLVSTKTEVISMDNSLAVSWRWPLPQQASPGKAPDLAAVPGGVLVETLVYPDQLLVLLDKATGTERWRLTDKGRHFGTPEPIDADYVGLSVDLGASEVLLRLSDGQVPCAVGRYQSVFAIDTDRHLYMAAQPERGKTHFYHLDLSTGSATDLGAFASKYPENYAADAQWFAAVDEQGNVGIWKYQT